jgi:hypothetical protein
MQECVHAIHQVEEYSIRPGASWFVLRHFVMFDKF